MSPNRGDRDDGRSRHIHRRKRERKDASIDSGYGGSSIASPKLPPENAPRSSHIENNRHHTKSARRESPSQDRHGLDRKSDGYRNQNDSDSDTDYDPRDKYYLDADDDAHEDISFRNSEAPEGGSSGKDRRQQLERGTSEPSGRSNHKNHRQKSPSIQSRDPASSTGSDARDRRRRYTSKGSDTPSAREDSRDRPSSRHPRSKASAASHSRHESNYRSLSPIPSEWGDSDNASSSSSSPARPRKASDSHRRRRRRQQQQQGHRDGPSGKSTRDQQQDASAALVDPEGETASSFLQKLTRGIDVKSVGKIGLDAAAVAAIKVAVGTRIPWQQRIPKTIAAGAAAAIMDFVAKKTSFQPKGMVGTIFARQFVEIILANLIINPVSSKFAGTSQKANGGGRPAIKGSSVGKGRR